MFKKAITILLASNFALGTIACGVKKAEERTLATMAEIEQRIEEHECPASVKTRSERLMKWIKGADIVKGEQ